MSRAMRQMRNTRSAVGVRIQGQTVDIALARIVYKCAECYGDLEIHNVGLRCKANHEHRHFIHRDEVAKIKELQEDNAKILDEFYQIINGKVEIKWQ